VADHIQIDGKNWRNNCQSLLALEQFNWCDHRRLKPAEIKAITMATPI
jgi:hypothetical protein